MQFMIIAAAAGVVGALLLNGWMTIHLHRHVRRIEQRIAVLEVGSERVSGSAWLEPAAASNRLKAKSPLGSNEAAHRRERTRKGQAELLPAHQNDAVNAEPARECAQW